MRRMTAAPTVRHTADERRDEIIAAAYREFADTGYAGTSTETIARRVGLSQPYLFRLFGTKRDLFLAAVERCFDETMEAFRHAADHGDPSVHVAQRLGEAYFELIMDRTKLRMQMQSYAATDDPVVRDLVRAGFGRLVTYIQSVSGMSDMEVADFMGRGMLLNVMASMDLLGAEEGWPATIREGCMRE
jgi:AcrR family transcriptional regulator